jgi:hypothetical protein
MLFAQRFEQVSTLAFGFGGFSDFIPEKIVPADSGNFYLLVNHVGNLTFKSQQVLVPPSSPKAYFIAKLDSNQNLLWLRSITTSDPSFSFGGYDLELDNQGNVYVHGTRTGVTNYANQIASAFTVFSIDIILKISSGGQILFVRDILPSFVQQVYNKTIKIGPDNSLYVTGSQPGPSNFNVNLYLQKWTLAGVQQFTTTQTVSGVNGSASIFPLGLDFDLTGNPNVLIRGASDGTSLFVNGLSGITSQAVYLVTYSRINGSTLNTRRVFNFTNRSSFLYLGDMVRKANGNFVIAAEVSGQITLNGIPQSSDNTNNIFLCEYNPPGNTVVWSNFISSPGGYELPGELLIDSAQNIYLSGFADVQASFGTTSLGSLLPGGFVAKYQQNGTLEWIKNQTQSDLNTSGSIFGIKSIAFDKQNRIVFIALNKGDVRFDANLFSFNTNSAYIGLIDCRPSDIQVPIVSASSTPCVGTSVQFFIPSTPFTDYVWTLSGGGTLTSAGNQATVQWTAPGNYTVSVVPQNACGIAGGRSISVQVRSAPIPPSQLIGDTVVCFAGSRAYSVTNDPQVFTYTWSLSGGGSLIPFSNNAIVNWAIPGSYQLSVAPSNDCGVGPPLIRTIVVTAPPAQPAAIAGVGDVCTGSQTYSIPAIAGTSYIWSLSSGGVLTDSANTATVQWTTSGVHTITVTPVNGCATGPSRNLNVTVRQAPGQPSSIIGNNVICRGFQTYSILETSGVSYNWSLPTGGSINALAGSATVNWTQQGVFTLAVTPQNSCGTGPSRSVLITVNDFPPSPGPILGLDSVCLGNQTYAVPAQAGTNYNWTLSGGGGLVPSGSSAVVNWATPGTYTLTVTPVNTCGLGAQVVKQIVVRNTASTITGISGSAEVCQVQETYSVPLVGGFGYTWGLTGGGVLSGASNTATVTWNTPGFHTLSVNTTDGCSRALLVQVRALPSQPSPISGDSSTCIVSKPYVISTINETSYTWTLTGGGSLSFNQGSALVNWTDTGLHVLTVTPQNQCGSGVPRNLTVRVITTPAAPTLISGADSACQGIATYQVNAIPGVSMAWQLNAGGVLTSALQTATVNWNTNGIFVLQVTPSNECGSGPQRTKTILVSNIPSILPPSGDTLVCFGSTVYRTVTNPDVQYNWLLSGGGILTAFQDSAVVAWNTIGTFQVRLTAQNFCGTSPVSTLSVRARTLPQMQPLITGDTLTCLGSRAYNILPEAETNYSWNLNGGGALSSTSATASINWAIPGAYLLTATPSNACGLGTPAVLAIRVIDIPVLNTSIAGNDTSCLTSQTYSVPLQQGTSYLWNISSGGTLAATSNQAVVNWQNTGSFTVSVQPLNQCGLGTTRIKAIFVTTIPASPTIQGDTLTCLGQNIYRTTPQVSQLFTWQLSGGGILTATADTARINWTSVGNQTIQLAAQNLCGSSAPTVLAVRVRTVPSLVGSITGDTLRCLGVSSYSVPFQPDAGWQWQISVGGTVSSFANTSSINWSQTGIFTISVSASNTCGSTPQQTLPVRVITLPSQPGIITGPVTVCVGIPQTFTIPPTGGVSYNWALSGGGVLVPSGASTGLSMNTTGNFNLTVTPSNQCGVGPSRNLLLSSLSIPAVPSPISGDMQSCIGTRFYSTFGLPGVTYNWSIIGLGTVTPSGNTAAVNWTGTGAFNVLVTASNVCGASGATSLPVTISTLPILPSPIQGDTFNCPGAKTYSVVAIPTTQYNWSLSSGGSLSSIGGQAIVNWNNPGIHLLTVTPSNLCGVGPARTLTVRSDVVPAQPTGIAGSSEVCIQTTNIFTVTPLPGISYNWSSPNATLTPGANGQVTVVWGVSGLFSLTVVPQNACGTGPSRSVNITVNNLPPATLPIVGRTTFCPQEVGLYSLPIVPNLTYQWNVVPNVPFFNFANGISVNWTEPGVYRLQVVPVNACGVGDTTQLPVEVFGPLTTPSLVFRNDTLFSSAPNRNEWVVNGTPVTGIDTGFFVPDRNSSIRVRVSNPCFFSPFARFVTWSSGSPKDFGIEIYPNPVQDRFTVQFPVNLEWSKIEVFDNGGRSKYSFQNNGDFRLETDILSWNKGLYLIKLFTEAGVLTDKLVVY